MLHVGDFDFHYTIPRTTRELQRGVSSKICDNIIPYQGLPGNYNMTCVAVATLPIIPYQGLPGNYNLSRYIVEGVSLGSVKG